MVIQALLVVINNSGDTKYMQIYTLFKAFSLELKGTKGLNKCFITSFIKMEMSGIESLSPLCGQKGLESSEVIL